MTIRLTVQPAGIEIDVEPGESLLEAAERAGYSWPSVCGRQGVCSTCSVLVLSANEALPAASSSERETLQMLPAFRDDDDSLRLGCQIRPSADLAVRKLGVRPIEVAGCESDG